MSKPEWLSRSLRGLSWIAALVSVLATAEWVAIVADGNYCWNAFGFLMIGGSLSAGILLLAFLPSAILYFGRRQKRDLWTIWLAGCSLLILLVEIVLVVWVIPQRGE